MSEPTEDDVFLWVLILLAVVCAAVGCVWLITGGH